MKIGLTARIVLSTMLFGLVVSACGFKNAADAKFGDQHFKTAIALIELYKVRHGGYPSSLSQLDFVGEWDRIAISSVEYNQEGTGYELNLVRGWMGTPTLEYPDEFWRGLGLKRSNLK